MTCILLLALACGKSASDHLEAARDDLDKGQYEPAIEDAEHGLQADPDDKTAWGLELVILEANARAGKVAETTGKLYELEVRHPDRLIPSLYSGSAQQLKDAGKTAEAIEVLDAGHKRFPDDPTIAKALEDAKKSDDPAALERLKSLGYIQ
jgi:tetratricopeptide (TPR) repeat protein